MDTTHRRVRLTLAGLLITALVMHAIVPSSYATARQAAAEPMRRPSTGLAPLAPLRVSASRLAAQPARDDQPSPWPLVLIALLGLGIGATGLVIYWLRRSG